MLVFVFNVIGAHKYCSLAMYSGKGGSENSARPSTAASKPESSAKPKVTIVEPVKVDGKDSDEDDDEEDEEDEDVCSLVVCLALSSLCDISACLCKVSAQWICNPY